MNESDVKRKIVDAIRAEGGYARRIEDQFSVGMPDLILIPRACPVVWAEVKIVDGNVFGPTPRQLIELEKLQRSPYSVPMVIGWKRGIHYISPPGLKIRLGECDEQREDETIGDFIRRALSHVWK
jgi:hypothetical protein